MMTHVIWLPEWCDVESGWWVLKDDDGTNGIEELDDGDEEIVVEDCVADEEDILMCFFVSQQLGLIF
jgi:hypothetical protein